MADNILLIIGNGFDLNCGLETKYIDFYNKRKEEINKDNNYFDKMRDYLTASFNNLVYRDLVWERVQREYFEKVDSELYFSKKINFWDIIFIIEEIKNKDKIEDFKWFDIEQLIKEKINILPGYMNEIYAKNVNDKWIKVLVKIVSLIKKDEKIINEEDDNINHPKFMKWLKFQLELLENSFKQYIKNQYETNKKYEKKSIELKRKIIGDNFLRCYNISYNYTPSKSYQSLRGAQSIIKIDQKKFNINLHGSIEGEAIIFGIDEKNGDTYIGSSSALYQFTKTYRRLFLHEENNFELQKVDEIYVYGHSLNEQDYSYFQSIFDFYNIYASSVKLIFAYSNYIEGVNREQDNVEKVIKLIKTYGQTLDNKDHGNNLLHKLSLENRLIIKEIKK